MLARIGVDDVGAALFVEGRLHVGHGVGHELEDGLIDRPERDLRGGSTARGITDAHGGDDLCARLVLGLRRDRDGELPARRAHMDVSSVAPHVRSAAGVEDARALLRKRPRAPAHGVQRDAEVREEVGRDRDLDDLPERAELVHLVPQHALALQGEEGIAFTAEADARLLAHRERDVVAVAVQRERLEATLRCRRMARLLEGADGLGWRRWWWRRCRLRRRRRSALPHVELAGRGHVASAPVARLRPEPVGAGNARREIAAHDVALGSDVAAPSGGRRGLALLRVEELDVDR